VLEAQPLQALERVVGARGERVERVGGDSEVGDRQSPRLEREPPEPADRRRGCRR
jgi:hypothetical protein